MSDALYHSMFIPVQRSSKDRRRKGRSKMLERISRFGIYGVTVAVFAMQASDPTLYASIASTICLALECLR